MGCHHIVNICSTYVIFGPNPDSGSPNSFSVVLCSICFLSILLVYFCLRCHIMDYSQVRRFAVYPFLQEVQQMADAQKAQAMQKAQKALLSKVSWQQVDVRGNLRRFVFSFLSFYL